MCFVSLMLSLVCCICIVPYSKQHFFLFFSPLALTIEARRQYSNHYPCVHQKCPTISLACLLPANSVDCGQSRTWLQHYLLVLWERTVSMWQKRAYRAIKLKLAQFEERRDCPERPAGNGDAG